MKMRSRSPNRLQYVESLEPRRLLAVDPVISEFMASNELALFDADGQSSDWIELHNPSDETINLDGWHLTDNEEVLDKWTLPNVSIEPRDYLTVFASGKDRSVVGESLHANFKLSADGEFLALTNRDAEIVFSYGTEFPAQSTDVSFGLQTSQYSFVNVETPGKSLVPTAAEADVDWTAVDFDDSAWFDTAGPIGFDSRGAIDNAGFEEGDLNHWQVFGSAVVVTDSAGIVPSQGEFQGRLNGYINAKARPQLERFLGLERFSFDTLGEGTADLGSVMKRRFQVEAGDVIEFDWNLLTNEPPGTGNSDFALFSVSPGIGGIKIADVSQEMRISESELQRETGFQEFRYTFPDSGLITIGVGIVNMESAGGESSLIIDNIRINGRGDAGGLYTDRIQTDVSQQMQNVNSSIWNRYEFQVDTVEEIDSLLVRAQYDDGIAVSVNGHSLTQQNAAPSLAWNSSAETDRDESEGLRYEDLFFGGDGSLLRPGKNVLAVQGLTSTSSDPTAFFNVELIGVGKVHETTAFFESPTPGVPNVTSDFNVASPVSFSVEHGLYDAPFELVLTTATSGGIIRFTQDGSVPSAENGETYRDPITVDTTAVVRAVTIKDGLEASLPETQTYIFVEDVVGQSNEDAIALGFPDTWGEFDAPRWPVKEADYELDPQIVGEDDRYNGKYRRQIADSLTSLPTLSLVMDVDDIFGPTGLHQDPRNRGVEWERPTSVELIYPDGEEGFQIDAGLRIQGGVSRVISQKQSFRLLFKDEYGDSKLNFPFFGPGAAEIHDSITLRSSTGEFLLTDTNNPGLHFIRDEHLRRSQLATGNLASQGSFMHLYINGLYWGVYNPVERMDGQFAANYLGGNKDDYDVLNAADSNGEPDVSPLQGNTVAWDAFVKLTGEMESAVDQVEKTRIYLQLQGLNPDGTRNLDYEVYLDRDNLIDYLITQVYSRNADWPIRNYYVMRQRGPESTGFKFLTWDGEFTLESGSILKQRISSVDADGVGIVYQGLKTSDLFRTHFSDRVEELFSPGGAFYTNPANQRLDPDHPEDNVALSRYLELVEEVDLALVAEAARWGDQTSIYWVEPFRNLNPVVFTPDERWRPVVDFNIGSFFPTRSLTFVESLIVDDHFRQSPVLPVPEVGVDMVFVEIDARHGEQVYYTLDGSDPMSANGGLSEVALEYTEPLLLNVTTTVKTRSKNADDQWSAIASATYLPQSFPADASNIRITEVNYNPHDAYTMLGEADVDNDQFEFIEIKNVSPTPVNLAGVRLVEFASKGVSFTFGDQTIAPGQHVVVPRDLTAFASRYGAAGIQLAVGDPSANQNANEFSGGIDNDGDLITLRDARNRIIQQFAFFDSGDWPKRADGNASSIEVIDLNGDYNSPHNYRNSSEFGGSPGAPGRGPDNRIVVNELLANSDAQLDQIELYNRTLAPMDISGWYLSDSNNDYLKYRLSGNESLNIGRFSVFDENQLGFRLDSVSGDDVYLIEAGSDGRPTRFVDRIQFDATAPGVSLGRLPDGSGQMYPMESVTLGAVNSGPLLGDIVVTEIQYDPGDPDGPGELTDTAMEYVELYNRGSAELDLSDWRIRGGVGFDFATGTTIGAGETLTLVSFDPANAATRTLFNLLFTVDSSAMLLGPLTGELDNRSDRVRILRPELPSPTEPDAKPYSLIDEVRYASELPWPEAIGGSNRSLHRNDVDAWGNDGRNWQLGPETPTKQNFTRLVAGDLNGDRLVTAADIDLLCSAIHRGAVDVVSNLDGNGVVDMADHSYLIQDILFTAAGDANLDRKFDSSDLVKVFIAGEYDDDIEGNSGWESGDWNCDGDFTSRDFVSAFMTGTYYRPAARPEGRTPFVPIHQSHPESVPFVVEKVDQEQKESPSQQKPRYAMLAQPYTGQSVDRFFDSIEPVWVPDADGDLDSVADEDVERLI